MKNSSCQPTVLVENNTDDHSLCIVQCKHCQRIGFMFNNLLADFDLPEFIRFSSAYMCLNFQRLSVDMHPHAPRILIRSCHRDIHFCFNQDEFDAVKDGFQQARLVLEANDALNNKR